LSFDSRYQVKQYVGIVRGRHGSFRVYVTGDSSHYLFAQLDPQDYETTLRFPVRKRDLVREVQSALANGMSIDVRQPEGAPA
jgi:hypothetical protein